MRFQTSVTVTVDTFSADEAQRVTADLVNAARRYGPINAGRSYGRVEFETGDTTVAPEPVRTAYTVMLTDAEHRRAVAQYGNILVPVPVTEPAAAEAE